MRRGISIGPIEFSAKINLYGADENKEVVLIPNGYLRTQSWSAIYPECVNGFISNNREVAEIFPMLIQLYNLFYGHSE